MDKDTGWFFTVTRISRDDLTDFFTPAEITALSDADMRWIAEQMEEAYLGSGDYWDALAQFAEQRLAEKGA